MKRLLKRAIRPFGIGVYQLGNEDGLIEPAHLRRFLRHFAVDCVFDVGANEGQYARRLRAIGYKGLILSFEPHPEVFKKLQELSADDARWFVYQLALDSEVRELQFNLMDSTQFSSLHAPRSTDVESITEFNKVARQVTLTTATLDEQFPALRAEFKFDRPFLKMDTQGHDMQVVEGGRNVLRHIVGLQSELALTRIYESSPSFEDSLSFYRSLGFKLSSLVPNNAGHFPDLVEMDCIMYQPAAA